MLGNVITFTINVKGDANNVVSQLTNTVDSLTDSVKRSTSFLQKFGERAFAFNQFTQIVENLNTAFQATIKPGVDLNTSLAELSAITGQTGKGLDEIEGYARSLAKTFGISASGSVESFKLVLSQLSPEIAKNPPALKAMGENIAILSKMMGGNATAAAETLTTAMNQYGVSLDDPIKASDEMRRMMNVMAAAAKEGSAELPQIKAALEQAGMTAKSTGVSFSEMNAAIQVLDKAGKKGSEGGVALRNIMAILSKGRFLPQDVQKELQGAQINIDALGDKSKGLSDRLALLKPLLNDSALLSKMFGMENQAAAMALINGVDSIDSYNEAIQGTNTAVDQANIIMESYQERVNRVKARFDDLKISMFNATGDTGIWVQSITSSLVPLAQILPLLQGMGGAFKWMISLNFVGYYNGFRRSLMLARIQLAFMNNDLKTGQLVKLGFIRNTVRATLALWRFATVGIFSALKGIGAYILSLVTGGAASATFAATSATSFAIFKTAAITAFRAVSVAIYSIPIIGWIALAAAAIGYMVYKWEEWGAAISVLLGPIGFLISQIKTLVDNWEMVKTAFKTEGIMGGFKALGKVMFEALLYPLQQLLELMAKIPGVGKFLEPAITKIKSWREGMGFKDETEEDKEAAKQAGMTTEDYKREAAKYGMTIGQYRKAKNESSKKGMSIEEYVALNPPTAPGTTTPPAVTSGVDKAATGGTRNTSINISLGKMFENLVFNGTLKENSDEVEKQMTEMLSRILFSATQSA